MRASQITSSNECDTIRYNVAYVAAACLKTVIGAVIAFVFLTPVLWMLFTSFDAAPTYTTSIPREWTLKHFAALLNNDTALLSLWNSLILAVGSAVVCTILGGLSAYALSRINVPGGDVIMYLIVLVSSVGTGTAAMVPLFQMMADLHLIDQQYGVILVLSAVALPTVIFILKDYFDAIPRSYEESARLMGASPIRILWDIVAPMAGPGLAFAAIWTMKTAWSDFLIPYLLLRDSDKQPAAVAMYSFYTEGGQADIGMLCAFALVFSVPVVILYVCINKKWGFSFGGGLKG